MLGDDVAVGRAGDGLDDQAQQPIPGVAVRVSRAGREIEGQAGEEGQGLVAGVGQEAPLFELGDQHLFGKARGVVEQLPDRHVPARHRIVRQIFADRGVEIDQVLHDQCRERLGDRRHREHGVRRDGLPPLEVREARALLVDDLPTADHGNGGSGLIRWG
nr:hypothetical protein [Kutzneria chonburiensis]